MWGVVGGRGVAGGWLRRVGWGVGGGGLWEGVGGEGVGGRVGGIFHCHYWVSEGQGYKNTSPNKYMDMYIN